MTVETDDWEWVVECPFDPPHEHRFPKDWFFGGPDLSDFRADARWTPSNYYYFSDRLQILHVTSAPGCDDQAIDWFTKIRSLGSGYRPKWIRVRRPDGTSETLPVIYDSDTDEVFETTTESKED